MLVTLYPSHLKNNQEENFLDQMLASLVHTNWAWKFKKMLGATRNCGRWFHIEAVKLPGTMCYLELNINNFLNKNCSNNFNTTS